MPTDPLPPKVREAIERTKRDERRRKALLEAALNDVPTNEAPPAVNLDAAFYERRPWLAHVRQAAHARAASADAVLAFVLARVCALTPHTLVLPPLVGGRASLNFFAVVIGPPGAGKSTALDVARELVPITAPDIADDLPLGSGEGLIESYFGVDEALPRAPKVQVRHGAFYFLDEGAALADMTRRTGSTLMPTLRSAWSGGTLGQMNASDATRRRLERHTYRLAFVLGAQYPVAGALLDEADLGTPQRFEWASASDPSIPDVFPSWPGSLAFEPPTRTALHGVMVQQLMTVAPSVADEIQQSRLGVARGEVELCALDAHAVLAREKVAALFAVLDGERGITAEHWEMAGEYRATSVALRQGVIDRLARRQAEATRRKQRAIVADATAVDEARERRARVSMARSMARHAERHGDPEGCDARCLARSTASKHRELCTVESAIEHALSEQWLRRMPGGARYLAGEMPS